jgi:hypothetical protein
VHEEVGSESDSQRGYGDKLEQLRSSDASNRRIIGQLNSQVRAEEDGGVRERGGTESEKERVIGGRACGRESGGEIQRKREESEKDADRLSNWNAERRRSDWERDEGGERKKNGEQGEAMRTGEKDARKGREERKS